MSWRWQINNGSCGFLMEGCNYFLPLQFKCNPILLIYHLYNSNKETWLYVYFLPICIIPCFHLLILFSFKIILITLPSSYDGSEWWPLNSGTHVMEMENYYFKFPLVWEAVGYFLHWSINDNNKQESLIKTICEVTFF